MTLAGCWHAIFVAAIGPMSRLDPSLENVPVNRLHPANPDIVPSSENRMSGTIPARSAVSPSCTSDQVEPTSPDTVDADGTSDAAALDPGPGAGAAAMSATP